MISQNVREKLNLGANLLAFSHGIDSTALFYILEEAGIKFDLAMVDYNVREQSKSEIKSAKELADKFGKKIYICQILKKTRARRDMSFLMKFAKNLAMKI